MIFLHGGVLCPADLAVLAASMPFALALMHYVRCRVAGWYERLRRTLRPQACDVCGSTKGPFKSALGDNWCAEPNEEHLRASGYTAFKQPESGGPN